MAMSNLPETSPILDRAAIRKAARDSIKHMGIERFCVLYRRNGKERQSPWFASREIAHMARGFLAHKYGRAIVFAD